MRAGTEARRMRVSREDAVLVDAFLYFVGIFFLLSWVIGFWICTTDGRVRIKAKVVTHHKVPSASFHTVAPKA